MAVLATRLTNFVNLYDFGNAHGRYVYRDFESFQRDILSYVEEYKSTGFYMGVTNSGQSKECKWLAEMGFHQVKFGNHLIQHYASYHELVKDAEAVAKEVAEREAAHQAALDARPRNAAGRLLRADGMVIRRPYEYFVGDRVRFRAYEDSGRKNTWGGLIREWSDWKEGTVRDVIGAGAAVQLKLRTRTVWPANTGAFNVELIERAQ